jgi:ribosomal RNA-processing protein 8
MSPPLFEVPGWSVSTEPVSPSSSKKSKKRKRPHDPNASDKLESAHVNLEKLMDTLDRVKRPPRKKHKGKKSTDSSGGDADNKPTVITPQEISPEKAQVEDAEKPSKKRKGGTHTVAKEKGKYKAEHHPTSTVSEDASLTTLQNQMKKKLNGARFR